MLFRPSLRSLSGSILWHPRMILSEKSFVFTRPLCRFTGRIIQDVINMGSYNFLGLAAKYDESMRTVKEVIETYGLGVGSTRQEMGMYVHYFEIFFQLGLIPVATSRI